jgi:hypothetical protein
MKMVDDRPYPSRKLTGDEQEERQKLIDKEHYELQEKWHEKGLQPIFDVGRLASPMWQEYRHLFKAQIKAGVKGKGGKKRAFTKWESKWVRPKAYKLSKEKFLNLKLYNLLRYLEPDDEDAYGKFSGFGGTFADISYGLMKADMAKVKHGSKVKLTEFQKNMILLDQEISREAAKPMGVCDQDVIAREWAKNGRGKKPWQYNRVFLQGTVSKDRHAILIVLTFNDPDEADTVHIWDSSHGWYPQIANNLIDWLMMEGYPNPEDELGEKHHFEDEPLQRDPFNCGQYMLITAAFLMRWEKPDYTGYISPADEPMYWDLVDPKYLWGRTDDSGNRVHKGLDEVVERFAQRKIKDYNKLIKWQTKEFKGFK